MTGSPDDDRALVDAARAALQRSEVAHQDAAAIPEAPPGWSADHAVLAEHTAQYEHRLAYFDPDRRLDTSGFDTLWTAEDALRREAAGWRSLGAAARGDWRVEFAAAADQADQTADAVLLLRQRVLERDRATELGWPCVRQQPEAER
jgi:hypothetical protein